MNLLKKPFYLRSVSFLVTLLTLVIALVLSWALVLFVFWLITLCFGWEWTLLKATGVWLCCTLLRLSVGDLKEG